jgi:lipopolysaccharide export system protein LptC
MSERTSSVSQPVSQPVPLTVKPRPAVAGTSGRRVAPHESWLRRRRFLIAWSKRLLPLFALLLLSSIALWPEIARQTARGRLALKALEAGLAANGDMVDARYHGVDEKNRPYTLTATHARQVTPERVDLTDPKGDVLLESGNWLFLSARKGVYIQHKAELDLEGDVTLYRDDGTTVHSATATVNLRANAAVSNDVTSAEGPFGTLDAMGFALTDRGAVIQFVGPARLVLNSRSAPAAPPAMPTSPSSSPAAGTESPVNPLAR